MKQMPFNIARCKTSLELLRIRWFLHAYLLRHRQYPEQLSGLVPEFIPHLPDDPFARSGPFHYKRDRDKYILYSLGPDGIDDGGKPIVKMDNDRKKDFGIHVDSKGDFVAWVNK